MAHLRIRDVWFGVWKIPFAILLILSAVCVLLGAGIKPCRVWLKGLNAALDVFEKGW